MSLGRIILIVFVVSVLSINLIQLSIAKDFNATITDVAGIETAVQGLEIRCGGNYYYAY